MMRDTYDEALSPDDIATNGVGMIAAAMHRASLSGGPVEAANLGKSVLAAIHSAQLGYMERTEPQPRYRDPYLAIMESALIREFMDHGGLE